jgi:antitoxin MazE
MSHIKVGKWGKNLALRVPGDIANEIGLQEGEQVEIEAHDGGIVIRRVAHRFTLEELFAGKSPEEWREAYADAFNWGADVGREIVEE